MLESGKSIPMTIQVEVSAEVEQRLAEEAKSRGMALSDYAGELLREASAIPHPSGPGVMTPEELQNFLREMALPAEHSPGLPNAAFSRESIYQDHD